MPLKILNNIKIICRYVKVNTFNRVVSILFYDKEKYLINLEIGEFQDI